MSAVGDRHQQVNLGEGLAFTIEQRQEAVGDTPFQKITFAAMSNEEEPTELSAVHLQLESPHLLELESNWEFEGLEEAVKTSMLQTLIAQALLTAHEESADELNCQALDGQTASTLYRLAGMRVVSSYTSLNAEERALAEKLHALIEFQKGEHGHSRKASDVRKHESFEELAALVPGDVGSPSKSKLQVTHIVESERGQALLNPLTAERLEEMLGAEHAGKLPEHPIPMYMPQETLLAVKELLASQQEERADLSPSPVPQDESRASGVVAQHGPDESSMDSSRGDDAQNDPDLSHPLQSPAQSPTGLDRLSDPDETAASPHSTQSDTGGRPESPFVGGGQPQDLMSPIKPDQTPPASPLQARAPSPTSNPPSRSASPAALSPPQAAEQVRQQGTSNTDPAQQGDPVTPPTPEQGWFEWLFSPFTSLFRSLYNLVCFCFPAWKA